MLYRAVIVGIIISASGSVAGATIRHEQQPPSDYGEIWLDNKTAVPLNLLVDSNDLIACTAQKFSPCPTNQHAGKHTLIARGTGIDRRLEIELKRGTTYTWTVK